MDNTGRDGQHTKNRLVYTTPGPQVVSARGFLTAKAQCARSRPHVCRDWPLVGLAVLGEVVEHVVDVAGVPQVGVGEGEAGGGELVAVDKGDLEVDTALAAEAACGHPPGAPASDSGTRDEATVAGDEVDTSNLANTAHAGDDDSLGPLVVGLGADNDGVVGVVCRVARNSSAPCVE